MMTDEEMLAKELGKVGAIAGGLGGGLGGAIGAGFGAKLASKYLPTETYKAEIQFNKSAETTLKAALVVLKSRGKLKETGDSKNPSLRAIIGSGFLNMNPAVVHLKLVKCSDGQCSISITAAAKEGLIKQRTAEKAVARIEKQLRSYLEY